MMRAVTDSRWTPQLRGSVYCSPRCGCGCTKAAYDAAVKAADALASRMGKGREPSIWENMGWHYIVTNGPLEIHPPHRAGEDYSAWIQTTPQFITHAKAPEDALGFAIQDARTHIRRIENILADHAMTEGERR